MNSDNNNETSQPNVSTERVKQKPLTRRSIKQDFRRKLSEAQEEGERDHLTGLLNPRGFDRRFDEEIQRILRFNEKATLLYLDVNNLKIVNDSGGHDAGNVLLKTLSDALTEITRTVDVVGRIGGDEFAAILVGLDEPQTQSLWDNRLNQAFESRGISIAVGASQIDPHDKEGTKKRADDAMYEAKTISKKGVPEKEMAKRSSLVFLQKP